MEEAANLPHPSERVDRMTQLRNEFQKAETYKYGYFMQASKLQILHVFFGIYLYSKQKKFNQVHLWGEVNVEAGCPH